MERRHSGSQPKVKRRKISVACDDCRAKKVRCDGVQPVCGPCRKRGTHEAQCNYTGELEKRKASQSYISSLESRIKQLESSRGPQKASVSNLTQVTSSVHASLAYLMGSQQATLLAPVCGTESETPQTYRTPQSQAYAYTPVPQQDGVNAMMGTVEEERANQGFFGSSSAAGFMRLIRTAVDKRVASPYRHSSVPRITVNQTLVLNQSAAHSRSAANYVLPPRKMADSLLEVYWDYVFPLYPFLISAQMKSEYAKVWDGQTLESDESMFMCTLNVIFALASQLADFVPPEEREASADAFFYRAKALFQFNLWETGSLELIQSLLLMAQYLQSTDSAHQCWIVTGLAVRNAQSLGLHLPETIAGFKNFQKQQLARKIWHGCVLMDRVISMTFGRPAMITKGFSGTVPLPVAVDDEFISPESIAEASQPPDQPSVMAFFGRSLELYDIMNDILLNIYNGSADTNGENVHDFYFSSMTGEGERTIFELDHCLTQWTRSLPLHLRGEHSMTLGNPVFCRQSIVLRARFLHVRMLLFRPALSRYCTVRDNMTNDLFIPLNDSFPRRIALQCSILCVKAAQDSIQLIYSNIPLDGTGGPLPAWWYNVLYVYTSATVLIAGRLCSAILAEVTEESIIKSWTHALEILRKYQKYSTSARRCVAALEILYEQVTSGEGLSPTDHRRGGREEECGSPAIGEMSFGEGMNASFLGSFEFFDFQDMSWLNSVPSNLY